MSNQSDNYAEQSTMADWKFLIGDFDWRQYGGSWYRAVGERQYQVIELINLKDAMGDDAKVTYGVSLKYVDLDEVSQSNVDSAVSCCGFRDDLELTDEILVEALCSYGLYAPMGDWEGNAYRSLLRQAKSNANDLRRHSLLLESALGRPVNRLGSTALEFMQGDTNSALIRGIAKGDTAARIVGKIQGLTAQDMDDIGPEYSDFSLTRG